MKRWKQLALWGVVALLVLSVAVCQKKAEKARTEAPPKETALSAAPEAVEKEVESAEKSAAEVADKGTKSAEELAAEAEKAAKEKAAKEKAAELKKKAEEEVKVDEKAAVEEPAKEIAPEDAVVVIDLAKGGRIVFKFYPKDAPNTVDNFIKLTNKGFYNGLTFHRVVPDFVVQGGCPKGDGTGGPGYKIKAEFNSQKHLDGTVAMARSTHPDSAGSQFYICLGAQPFLDGEYTVFGQVIEGMELVRGIQVGDVMKKVTIMDKASLAK